ncbi:uncharacterized protein PGTG_08361 [Puccinia graminis f. sp. tritici CRL 75-36-700-3]|uniref:Uncharacterized protein n=1 Tax=Puccinia graminis f. sp. tritici (strain CRL 75-36-700-3 / race SCCL) TaxID=418459 RepID=E3KDG9_PUCGT|nr:uncharacterized protein PGTG_08361 [Puccinia graminis f. sp. tritici CRL 75-36-700-3]EFP82405.1 hypothetical protein PGTG_08361 [Puccinia graminis f. sp. tritici CRL 75-36-700-3]
MAPKRYFGYGEVATKSERWGRQRRRKEKNAPGEAGAKVAEDRKGSPPYGYTISRVTRSKARSSGGQSDAYRRGSDGSTSNKDTHREVDLRRGRGTHISDRARSYL